MIRQLRPAIRMVVIMTMLTGFIYPFMITGLAKAAFSSQANGSLIRRNGQIIGSTLIGQSFSKPEYFHPRLSNAGNGYDASNSGGSNLGPTNKQLIENTAKQAELYREENGLSTDQQLPADAVTTSGSGLDPDISPANASLQSARVANARGVPLHVVQDYISRYTEGRQFGILGEPRVNVLKLNLALDALKKR